MSMFREASSSHPSIQMCASIWPRKLWKLLKYRRMMIIIIQYQHQHVYVKVDAEIFVGQKYNLSTITTTTYSPLPPQCVLVNT